MLDMNKPYKPKNPNRNQALEAVHIKMADNGGFIVECMEKPAEDGNAAMSYTPAKKKVFMATADLFAFLEEALTGGYGETAEKVDDEDA